LHAPHEFAERVIIKTTGEGEKGKEGGLEGTEGSFLIGGVGGGFDLAGEGGGESGGVEQVGDEKGDRFQRLAAGLVGGKKRRKRLEFEGL